MLSPAARQALRLLGALIEEGRLRKGWSRETLAERVGVGIGVITVRRITRGEPGVAIGSYFEAAALVDIRLFGLASTLVDREQTRHEDTLTLLPSRVRRSDQKPVNDDF